MLFRSALTSFAVVGYLNRHAARHGIWTRLVAPTAAGIALAAVFAMIVANFDVLIGLQEASILGWLLPVIVLVPGVLGMLWAVGLRGRSPEVYAGIGYGGDAPEAAPAQEQGPQGVHV